MTELKMQSPELQPTVQPQPAQVDMVNEPPHYKQGKVECLDAIESAVIGLDPIAAVCVANIFKYTWRHSHKGKTVEDLKKGRFYYDKLIKHYEGEKK